MNSVCVAGTFDHIHVGHEALLTKAFAIATHVLIGVTSDVFTKRYKKYAVVRPSDARKQDVEAWLDIHGYRGRYDIVFIDDPYEPAVSLSSVEALVVSQESQDRAETLNAKRIEKGLKPLTIVIVPTRTAKDGKPISSSRVRTGEIDTKGNLVLPRILRDQLTRPMGLILQTKEAIDTSFAKHADNIVIVVGDATTKAALDAGVKASLIVIDNKVERKTFTGLSKYRQMLEMHTQHIISGPGFIARVALDAIASWGTNPKNFVVLDIEGEEDLLTLPVIVHAPIGSIVYYGQPQVGLVEVIVTEEKKKEAQILLSQFVSP